MIATASFVIELDSSISKVNVLIRGYGTHELSMEIKNTLESSPYWVPGQKNGEAVRTSIFYAYRLENISEKVKKRR